MAGYVICANCGARIKADRPRCLRCEEPLRPASDATASAAQPWFDTDRGRLLIVGVVASSALLFAVALLSDWQTAAADDVARPAPGAARATVQPAAPAQTSGELAAVSAVLPSPVSYVDSTRAGGLAYAGGDFQAAKSHFEQALAKRPDDAEAMNNLGQALVRLGQVDDGIARFQRAIQIAPDKWTYHFNLAHALGQQGQWDKAIDEYRIASGLFPEDYAAQYNLAMALHKKGDDQAAVVEYQKAIALAPSEASFHFSLGISLEKVGKRAEAQREYQQYLEMDPSAPEAEKLKAHIRALAGGQTAPQPKPSSVS